MRQVICTTTNEVFDSITTAANYFGLHQSAITSVCRRKLPSTGGLKFKYQNEPVPEVIIPMPRPLKVILVKKS